jgi:hypothetical protein
MILTKKVFSSILLLSCVSLAFSNPSSCNKELYKQAIGQNDQGTLQRLVSGGCKADNDILPYAVEKGNAFITRLAIDNDNLQLENPQVSLKYKRELESLLKAPFTSLEEKNNVAKYSTGKNVAVGQKSAALFDLFFTRKVPFGAIGLGWEALRFMFTFSSYKHEVPEMIEWLKQQTPWIRNVGHQYRSVDLALTELADSKDTAGHILRFFSSIKWKVGSEHLAKALGAKSLLGVRVCLEHEVDVNVVEVERAVKEMFIKARLYVERMGTARQWLKSKLGHNPQATRNSSAKDNLFSKEVVDMMIRLNAPIPKGAESTSLEYLATINDKNISRMEKQKFFIDRILKPLVSAGKVYFSDLDIALDKKAFWMAALMLQNGYDKFLIESVRKRIALSKNEELVKLVQAKN